MSKHSAADYARIYAEGHAVTRKASTPADVEAQIRSFDEDICDVCAEVFRVEERDAHPCWVTSRFDVPLAEQLMERKRRARTENEYVRGFSVATDVLEQLLAGMSKSSHVFWARHEVGAHYDYGEYGEYDEYDEDDYAGPTITYDEGAHSTIALRFDHTELLHEPTFPPGGVRVAFWPPVRTRVTQGLAESASQAARQMYAQARDEMYRDSPLLGMLRRDTFFRRGVDRAAPPQRLAGLQLELEEQASVAERIREAARRIEGMGIQRLPDVNAFRFDGSRLQRAQSNVVVSNPIDIANFAVDMRVRFQSPDGTRQGSALVTAVDRAAGTVTIQGEHGPIRVIADPNVPANHPGYLVNTDALRRAFRDAAVTGLGAVTVERVPPWAMLVDEALPNMRFDKAWRRGPKQSDGSRFNGTPRNLRVSKRRGER